MYLCTCVCVCMYVHVYVCMYESVAVCVHVYMYMCVCVCVCRGVCTCVFVWCGMCLHVHVCACLCLLGGAVCICVVHRNLMNKCVVGFALLTSQQLYAHSSHMHAHRHAFALRSLHWIPMPESNPRLRLLSLCVAAPPPFVSHFLTLLLTLLPTPYCIPAFPLLLSIMGIWHRYCRNR